MFIHIVVFYSMNDLIEYRSVREVGLSCLLYLIDGWMLYVKLLCFVFFFLNTHDWIHLPSPLSTYSYQLVVTRGCRENDECGKMAVCYKDDC